MQKDHGTCEANFVSCMFTAGIIIIPVSGQLTETDINVCSISSLGSLGCLLHS